MGGRPDTLRDPGVCPGALVLGDHQWRPEQHE
jgi:hypothetical protein